MSDPNDPLLVAGGTTPPMRLPHRWCKHHYSDNDQRTRTMEVCLVAGCPTVRHGIFPKRPDYVDDVEAPLLVVGEWHYYERDLAGEALIIKLARYG